MKISVGEKRGKGQAVGLPVELNQEGGTAFEQNLPIGELEARVYREPDWTPKGSTVARKVYRVIAVGTP